MNSVNITKKTYTVFLSSLFTFIFGFASSKNVFVSTNILFNLNMQDKIANAITSSATKTIDIKM